MDNSDLAAYADTIAQYLADKFNNPTGLSFYRKVAWHVPLVSIERLLKISMAKTSPGRYFSVMAKNEMNK